MPNPMPTYMEEIMVMETMKPISKLQKKSLDEMKKVLSKGNVLSQKQKKELEMLKQIPVPEGYGLDTEGMMMSVERQARNRGKEAPEGFDLDTTGLALNTGKERYNREAKQGEASPKDFKARTKPSEADLNDRLEADSQVGLPNVFDLAKKDANAARAMLRTPAPVVR